MLKSNARGQLGMASYWQEQLELDKRVAHFYIRLIGIGHHHFLMNFLLDEDGGRGMF